MISKIQNIRGTQDVYDENYRILAHVQKIAFSIAQNYFFIPIDTPIIEFTEVFYRSLDATSDIINKEIYNFKDKSDENISLRPEFTAAIARAFVQNLQHKPMPVKLFSSGPLFRYERPQKGRMRQFNQFNFEIIGTEDHHYDIEIIQIAYSILKKVNIVNGIKLEINSLGDSETKKIYKDVLARYLIKNKNDLSENSQKRLYNNTLRIFDSKNIHDQEILDGAPRISEYYNKTSDLFFNDLQLMLKDIGIDYSLNHKLVRGLDYYSHTVFEIKTQEEKSQNTLIGGGRYSELISLMGGKNLGCVGMAGGIERIIDVANISLSKKINISLAPIGQIAESFAQKLAFQLRESEFNVEYLHNSSLKKRLTRATEHDIVLIFGEKELMYQSIKIKYMKTNIEDIVKISDIEAILAKAQNPN